MRNCKDGKCNKVRNGEEIHPEHGKSTTNRNVIYYTIIVASVLALGILTPELVKHENIADNLLSVWVAIGIGIIGIVYALHSTHELKKYVEWGRYVQHATTYFNDEEWELAINYFDKSLEITPKNLALLNNAGASYSYLTKHDKALPYYEKILDIEPNNIPALNNRGLALEKLKRYPESQSSYEKALQIDLNDIDTLNNLGILFYEVYHRYARAIEFFDRILQFKPDDAITLGNKARALIAQENFEEAIECCNDALKADPRNVDALNQKGRAFMHLEKFEDVVTCGKLALQIMPLHFHSLKTKTTQDLKFQYKIIFNVAIGLGKLGRYEESKTFFDQYLTVIPNDPQALRFKGDCLAALGNLEESIEYYNKALRITPYDWEILNVKGVSLIALGKTVQGLLTLNESLKFRTTHNPALYNKTFYLSANPGNESEVEEIYREVINENPTNEDEVYKRARALFFLRDYEPAKAAFDDLIRNDPKSIHVLLQRANLLYATEDYEEALLDYNKVLKIDPKNTTALLDKGSTLVKMGHIDRAIETCYNQVLQFEPLYVAALYNKGVALSDQRKFNEALTCYTTVQEIEPDHRDSWLNKGECLRELGRYHDALDCYDKVRALDPSFTKILRNISYVHAKLEDYPSAWEWWYNFLEGEGLERNHTDQVIVILRNYFNSPEPRGPLSIIFT